MKSRHGGLRQRLARERRTRLSRYRKCRLEQMEPRMLLSAAPIQLGMVYYEDATGTDESGDTFELTFQGGAPGTQLTRVIIDTDKLGDGLTIGDCFFDTEPGGLGAFGYGPSAVLSSDGIDSYQVHVADGGTKLILEFTGFEAGDRFLFTIDVDEMGFLGPNAVAEGNEFEGSRLTAFFTAPHYYAAQREDIFLDAYDHKLVASGLDLPRDDYSPPLPEPEPVRTAGAFLTVTQTPLPVAISGRVFEDFNLDVTYNGQDRPLAGITLELWRLEGETYIFTGRTTNTDTYGSYRFDNLLPGTYRLVEHQPDGYLSVGAKAGSVASQVRGAVLTSDIIEGIALLGGEESIHNDFAEVRPGALSGHVYHDANNNGLFDPGESGIGGVTIVVTREADHFLPVQQFTVLTQSDGSWSVSGLSPGQYRVEEHQPDGWLDGLDRAGSLGGSAINPGDQIVDVKVPAGREGINYNFGELLPASLAGLVYLDLNTNCQYDANEPTLPGVTIELRSSEGVLLQTTVTDAAGRYIFENLLPGTYAIHEIQPAGYFDGCDRPGTAGGVLSPPDTIADIHLGSAVAAVGYLFAEIPPASLSGLVFSDQNANDRLDLEDTPIAGVTIQLFDRDGQLVASAATGADGRYLFENLRPGYYTVVEIQPEGYLDGPDFVGTAGGQLDGNDRITDIKLPPGMQGKEYNFSEIAPATISGYVFQDGPAITYLWGELPPDPYQVRDGQFTPDDTPLAGVEIHLCDATGQPIRDGNGQPIVAWTNAEGYYEFRGLRPGVYTILEIHPGGYEDSLDTPGTLGGIAVNPNTSLDPAILASLTIDPRNDAILGVTVQPGANGANYNFAEVLVTAIPPFIPPIDVPPEIPAWPKSPDLPPPMPPIYLQISPVMPDSVVLPRFGGSAGRVNYTWHLSVINGGNPRHNRDGFQRTALREVSFFDPTRWQGIPLDRGEWAIADIATGEVTTNLGNLGTEAALPAVGDFSGVGHVQLGIFFGGMFFIDLNGNGFWDEGDLWIQLGKDGDQPVAGDWDGDGKWDVGIFGPEWPGDDRALRVEPGLPDAQNRLTALRPRNLPPTADQAPDDPRFLQLGREGPTRADLIDHVFMYGQPGDHAVTGDWNGDGIATIGVFRGGTWYLDEDGDGRWGNNDRWAFFGQDGDIPVVGDWNGDGRANLGVYRDGRFYLDTDGDFQLTANDRVVALGESGDRPFAGDFNGDGRSEVGVYRSGGPNRAGSEGLPTLREAAATRQVSK
ncbi:MAG: SdrD B-like domain-containing protein [Thermogutta sp.]